MIKSAPFSFVRFEHPAPGDDTLDIPYSLPAFGNHDVLFHFIVDNDRPLDQYIKMAIADTDGAVIRQFPVNVLAVPLTYHYRLTGLQQDALFDLNFIQVNQTYKMYGYPVSPAQLIEILADDWGIEVIDDYFVLPDTPYIEIGCSNGPAPTTFAGVKTPFWHEAYVGISNYLIQEDDCFTYALTDYTTGDVLGYTNPFKVADDASFTSMVTYGCKEPAFAFTYTWDDSGIAYNQRQNRVRLPLHLLKPDWPATRKVNRQSNGRTQLLSATVEKQYAFETEHMPEVFHECMRMALLHDFLLIENSNIREGVVEVIEADNYTVAWNDEYRLSYAQGKGTLKVASFGYTNSNC